MTQPCELAACPASASPSWSTTIARPPSLGYEAPEDAGLVRCLAHGFPTPLARWHFHDEYELHLITATSGKAFVGDWIGPFQPGHLVLCGPRLPHNWISLDVPEGGVAERDLRDPVPPRADRAGGASDPRAGRGDAAARARAPRHRVLRPVGARAGALAAASSTAAACSASRRSATSWPTWRAAPTTGCCRTCRCRARTTTPRLDQINAIVNRITGDVAKPLSASRRRGRARHEREPLLALLPARHRQHLHRLRQPRARQPRLPAADGDRPPGDPHLLRGRASTTSPTSTAASSRSRA